MRKSACLLPVALRIVTQSASVGVYEVQSGILSHCPSHRVSPFWGASKLLFRHIISSSNEETSSSDEDDASDDKFREKLRQIAGVVQVHQDLKHESELHDIIPVEKLFHLILDRGAARDKAEARELVTAMQRAGIMVLHSKHVYLNPNELIEHRLPDFPKAEELEAKLEEIEEKLQPYEEIQRTAEKKAWQLMYYGCFVIALQLAVFLRLTYYELSWDVMEPIGYIISLFYSLLGYFFFIYTRGHPFDLQPVKEWYAHRLKGKGSVPSTGTGLDEERYEALVKARDRYLKRLQFLQKVENRLDT